jgi:hypothetical protein
MRGWGGGRERLGEDEEEEAADEGEEVEKVGAAARFLRAVLSNPCPRKEDEAFAAAESSESSTREGRSRIEGIGWRWVSGG